MPCFLRQATPSAAGIRRRIWASSFSRYLQNTHPYPDFISTAQHPNLIIEANSIRSRPATSVPCWVDSPPRCRLTAAASAICCCNRAEYACLVSHSARKAANGAPIRDSDQTETRSCCASRGAPKKKIHSDLTGFAIPLLSRCMNCHILLIQALRAHRCPGGKPTSPQLTEVPPYPCPQGEFESSTRSGLG